MGASFQSLCGEADMDQWSWPQEKTRGVEMRWGPNTRLKAKRLCKAKKREEGQTCEDTMPLVLDFQTSFSWLIGGCSRVSRSVIDLLLLSKLSKQENY